MTVLGDLILRVRQDVRRIVTIDGPRPVLLHGAADVHLKVYVERLDAAFLPPLHRPVDITGLAGRLLLKADVDDEPGAALLDALLTVTDGPGGLLTASLTIPDEEANLGYGEIIVTDAGDPVLRAPFDFIVLRAGVAL